MNTYLNWICPKCGEANHDEIDPVLGPFLTCTCDRCGLASDQDAVKSIIEEQTK